MLRAKITNSFDNQFFFTNQRPENKAIEYIKLLNVCLKPHFRKYKGILRKPRQITYTLMTIRTFILCIHSEKRNNHNIIIYLIIAIFLD